MVSTSGSSESSGPSKWTDPAIAFSYFILFALMAWRWLAAADRAIPTGSPWAFPDDARVIVFNMGWVAQALGRDPLRWLDAPIFFPAPGQLTGCDSFITSHLLFTPIAWMTGNPVMAASLTAFISYPVAAYAMYILAKRLGAPTEASWASGLVFALAPMRSPGNLQVIQYPNLFLPWVALSMHRLSIRPDRRSSLAAAAALSLALLSSFYMALLTLLVVALWVPVEWMTSRGTQYSFLTRAIFATGVALVPFVVFGWPWMSLSVEALPETEEARSVLHQMALRHVHDVVTDLGPVGLGSLAGIGALASVSDGSRRLARFGIVFLGAGTLLMLGRSFPIGNIWIPLPWKWLAMTPARFFRLPARFAVLAGFGASLLLAAFLSESSRRWGHRGGLVACAIVALGTFLNSGLRLASGDLDGIRAQHEAMYEDLRRLEQDEREPASLLELPQTSNLRMLGKKTALSEPEAMVGVLRHGVPLVNGESRFPPSHDRFIRLAISNLTRGGNLDDLVDMTHLRWVILRPQDEWLRPEDRASILHHPGLIHVRSRDGFDLLRVQHTPSHPDWFAAIAAGPKPGRSTLGTPFGPVSDPSARLAASADPTRSAPGSFFDLTIRLENLGRSAWPSAQPGLRGNAVILKFRIVPWDTPETDNFNGTIVNLWRDIPPGEELRMTVPLQAPMSPGSYRLDLLLMQPRVANFATSSTALEVLPSDSRDPVHPKISCTAMPRMQA